MASKLQDQDLPIYEDGNGEGQDEGYGGQPFMDHGSPPHDAPLEQVGATGSYATGSSSVPSVDRRPISQPSPRVMETPSGIGAPPAHIPIGNMGGMDDQCN